MAAERLDASSRHAHRLLQLGVGLLLAGLIVGVAVPQFAVPRLALSTHLLGVMQGLLLVAFGLLWPGLKLSAGGSTVGCWLAGYGCLAAWTANLLAALWAAGNTLLPLAAGHARGTPLEELTIVVLLRTGGGALIAVTLLVLWGLRGTSRRD